MVLRFQCVKSQEEDGEARIHAYESGEAWIGEDRSGAKRNKEPKPEKEKSKTGPEPRPFPKSGKDRAPTATHRKRLRHPPAVPARGGIRINESWSRDAGWLVERFRRGVIHREISRVLCPPTLWQPRGAKNTAQEKCCLTTPSFLSTGTRNQKPSEKASPPAHPEPPRRRN